MEGKTENTGNLEHLDWGHGIPERTARIIKENLKVMEGFDETEVLKGHIFERILYDDAGEFGAAIWWLEGGVMKPEEALEHKNTFLNRLRWEAEQPQTPQPIKEAIEAVREKSQSLDWSTKANIQSSRAHWEEMVFSKANGMVDANEDGAGEAHRQYLLYYEESKKRGLPH